MAIPALPEWIAIIVCVIILAFSAIAVIKATAAANIVSNIDENVAVQMLFIKRLTADAQNLITSTKTDELHAEANKVYEAICYSDPMTSDELSELDSQIRGQFTAFADAVKSEDTELAKETANALIEMVERRNQKCKILK